MASLGGLLGLHWRVPGLAANDPSPGGAIVLERLTDDRGGAYVRALYRSQTVEQIRGLVAGDPHVEILPIAGCLARGVRGLCTGDQFRRAMATR